MFLKVYASILSSFVASLSGYITYAQTVAPIEDYIQSFPQTVTVRTFIGEKISFFRLEDRGIGQNLRYYPNNSLEIGGGVTIRGVGLNFSTKLPYHSAKDDLYGKTKRYDLQVHSYGRKIMLDAYLQQYTGFHLKSRDDVTMIQAPTEYPYFPTMSARAVGMSGLYVFNGEKYSLRTIVSQQEWQLRSAGSWLLGGSLFNHLFTDDNTLIPSSYKYPEFFGGQQPKQIEYYGITVNGGYGYTAVIDHASHYFVAGAADAGGGVGYSIVSGVSGGELKNATYCLTANIRFGFGYNGTKCFSGLYFIYHTDRYPLPYDKSNLNSSMGILRFSIARRISTRKKILAKQPKNIGEGESDLAPLQPVQ